jgi:probable rRNA maturation factor
MRIEFEFINEVDPSYDEYESLFKKLLKQAMLHLGIVKDIILETTLVNNQTIAAFNKQYRGIDKATDVLSFAFQDEVIGERRINDLPFLNLGTIIISIDKAIEQAESLGHGIKREMSFLFIHGLLHLFGYDHQDENDEKKMLELQDAIIGKRTLK